MARWIDNIRELKGKVNPRVAAANIKLAYNGWPCHKRCGISDSKCFLCGRASDSSKHIVKCQQVDSLLKTFGASVPHLSTARTALLLVPRSTDVAHKVRIALVMHAVYDLLNNIRHGHRRNSDCVTVIKEHLKNSIEGSPFSACAMHRWLK